MGDGLDLDALLVPSPQTSADKGNRGRRVSTGNAAVNGPDSYLSHQWKPAIIKACKAVITAEPTITHYDTVWGDADCGLTLKSGANAVLSGFDNQSNNLIPLDPQQPDLTMAAISELVEDSMGGTSGGIYCIMLDALAAQLQSIREEIPNDQGPTLKQWATSLEAALETLEQYTTARVGHRTLMDALTPFIQSLLAAASDDQASPRASLVKAVDAAYQGMEGTKKMVPRRGRATYIGGQDESDTDKYEMPDPGAYGLYTLLKGLLDASKA
ncbi:dihydroxyacetone kinase Dak1 [Dimargaris verticillata]|uniref:Dihydroxyacetone kinase Dak1 n=1 Tax=Dimargaris verticillata TaxID=2761393 RepID=A0A9W8AZY6_9FUNG|nr:dihydroxyacetone kinase Dak1 [Dimargaris verticillata]